MLMILPLMEENLRNTNMKTIMTALPTICICMVLLACSTVTKKKFFETKAKAEKGDIVAQYTLGRCTGVVKGC